MKIPVLYPFLYCQCIIPGIDIVVFAQLQITADDYFVTSNGAVYDAIQAAYIVLWIMGYLHVSFPPSTVILPASVCLPVCMFCSCVCMCERTTRNTQS